MAAGTGDDADRPGDLALLCAREAQRDWTTNCHWDLSRRHYRTPWKITRRTTRRSSSGGKL